jgi:hypothetical protein
MADPSTTQSLKVEKTFTYRGGVRVFSNRYHFTGGPVTGNTQWTTLADAVTTAEKAIYPSTGFSLTITQAIGYDAGSEVPVFSKTYALAGTLAIASAVATPGDCAALIRYSTADRTSKNHPIYLFNYYHGALGVNATTADTLYSSQRTLMGTYAGSWITGFSDGTHTLVRTGPYGHVATGQLVATTVHHRDFPGG